MAKYPALPLWTDAWVADTHHLSRLQRGTYFDLLVLMWRTPECRVPNDDSWLAVHMRLTPAEVELELRPIIQEFCTATGNWIFQKRLRKEFGYVEKLRPKQKERINSRWNFRSAQHAGPNGSRLNSDTVKNRSVPRKSLKSNKMSDTTYTYTTIEREDSKMCSKRQEEIAELSCDAQNAIASHEARQRELTALEANPSRRRSPLDAASDGPPKTERGRQTAKEWLERKDRAAGLQPLTKYVPPPTMNGHAVTITIDAWPAPSDELIAKCG